MARIRFPFGDKLRMEIDDHKDQFRDSTKKVNSDFIMLASGDVLVTVEAWIDLKEKVENLMLFADRLQKYFEAEQKAKYPFL